MQSTIGVVFRALVMLACLALVPGLAMYGKYLPGFAKAVIDTYKARTQTEPEPSAAETGGAAPAFGPAAYSGGPPRSAAGTQATSLPPGSRADAPATWPDLGAGAKPLSDWQQPPTPGPAGGPQRASYESPASSGTAPLASPGDSPRPADLTPTAAPEDCTAQFRRIERRLRELGASYYLLETWGPAGDRYRFLCKMALASNAGYNRVFQATAADPLAAMQEVLQQVEQWRAGGQP